MFKIETTSRAQMDGIGTMTLNVEVGHERHDGASVTFLQIEEIRQIVRDVKSTQRFLRQENDQVLILEERQDLLLQMLDDGHA